MSCFKKPTSSLFMAIKSNLKLHSNHTLLTLQYEMKVFKTNRVWVQKNCQGLIARLKYGWWIVLNAWKSVMMNYSPFDLIFSSPVQLRVPQHWWRLLRGPRSVRQILRLLQRRVRDPTVSGWSRLRSLQPEGQPMRPLLQRRLRRQTRAS